MLTIALTTLKSVPKINKSTNSNANSSARPSTARDVRINCRGKRNEDSPSPPRGVQNGKLHLNTLPPLRGVRQGELHLSAQSPPRGVRQGGVQHKEVNKEVTMVTAIMNTKQGPRKAAESKVPSDNILTNQLVSGLPDVNHHRDD
eukprot:744724-Amphidinium_carterae.1